MKKILTLLMLATALRSSAQITPVQLNHFENTLTASVGTNATTSGAYSYAAGQVGQALKLTTTGKSVNIGTLANTQKATIEFLYKSQYGFDATDVTTLVYIGSDNSKRMVLQFNLNNLITASPSDYNLLFLNGIGRKNYAYYVDTLWHHIVYTYNGSTARKSVWVDGQVLINEIACPAGSVSGPITLSSDYTYSRMIGQIDEVAIYNDQMTPSQIYSDYLAIRAGSVYPGAFYSGAVPAPTSTTAPADVNEFPLGYVVGSSGNTSSITNSYYTQLRISPLPRYANYPLVQRNYNIGNLFTQAGNGNTVTSQVVDTMRKIQREMARNYYYGILGLFNQNGPYDMAKKGTVQCANENTEFTLDVWTNYAQMRKDTLSPGYTGEHLLQQTYPPSYYVRNASFQFLQPNGGVGTFKWPDTYTPSNPMIDSINLDAKQVSKQLRVYIPKLTRSIDRICDNGENQAFWGNTCCPVVENLASSPTVAASQATSGLTWNVFKGRQWAIPYKLMADSMRLQVPSAKVAFYNIAGDTSWNSNWSQARLVNSVQSNGFRYSTLDFYPRYPWNWHDGYSAWHGYNWIFTSRQQAFASGDSLYSPFIAAGWEANFELDVRPAQYLGMLKTLSAYGVDFFYSGYWDESNNISSKSWCWQFQIPSYAQAINSKLDTLFIRSKIMSGDVPPSYQYYPSATTYCFYAGDKRATVNVRKSNSSNKYIIYGSLNATSNMTGAIEANKNVHITLGGNDVYFDVRRQGSVYVYDNSVSPPVFYQVDKWHEYKSPERWSTDIAVEAELPDSATTVPALKTTGTSSTYNFTTYDTYISTVDTMRYNVKVRQQNKGSYYLFVRVKSPLSTRNSFKAIVGASTQTVSCISNTWDWYAMQNCNAMMKFTLDTNSVLKLICADDSVYIDQFVFSLDSTLYTSAPACTTTSLVLTAATSPCTSPCTITVSAGSHQAYLWNTGAVTSTVTTSTIGATTFTCTVTDNACASSDSIIVTILNPASATASVTPASPLICADSTITLTAGGSGTISAYLWSTGATTSTISPTPSSTTTYTVTVTSNLGSATASSKVTVKAKPVPVISPTSPIFASSTTLSVSGGTTYLWNTGSTATSITASIGTYTVTATTVGCTASTTAKVAQAATAYITQTASSPICNGNSVTLTAYTSGATASAYLWSIGAVTQSIALGNLPAGTQVYTVTVTTDSGTATATSTVVVNARPSVAIAPSAPYTSSTSTTSITASGGSAYLWSTGATSASISVGIGTYTVTASAASGCTSTSTVAVASSECPDVPYGILAIAVPYDNGNEVKCSEKLTWRCLSLPDKFEIEITNTSGHIRYRTVGGTNLVCYLTGLTSQRTPYKIRIRSVCAASVSSWSGYVSFSAPVCN